MSKKLNVAVVGCGNISGIYFTNLSGRFQNAKITTCADLDIERARAIVEKKDKDGKLLYPDLKACRLDEAYTDPDIDIILNLTIPKAHHEVAMKALSHGKHVYGEKPLCSSMTEALELVQLAKDKDLRVGCAPDTFLGAGIQTTRKLIDDGWIGDVVSANVSMNCRGHESWHPDPEFYYQVGGGPLFDMGPYYLTALVHFLGPVEEVCAMGTKAFEERTITSKPKFGEKVPVEVLTHLVGQMSFSNNVIANLTMSFDTYKSDEPCIEIHGTKGSLSVPDPNGFGGEVKIRHQDGGNDWAPVPLIYGYSENSRGLGVDDMANGILNEQPHRASGDLALHVLEIMHALDTSAQEKSYITTKHRCERPENFS
jgi:predicted dehydrogenase